MKHILLILISLLLLSSPVIGQETGVLYQYETSTGIQWKSFGDGKVQPKYKGEIKNGKMDGLGVLTYPYDGKSIIGEWKDGKEWNTKHSKKDGKLIGKWIDGKQYMVLFYSMNLNLILDNFLNSDDYYGFSEDGDEKKDMKYVGEIKNGKPNGQGTFTYPDDGNKYVGEWKDGKEHGQGTLTWSNRDKYVGEWKDGKWDGQGTYTGSNGNKYVGEYKDGEKHGQGTYTFPVNFSDGRKYVGEWKDGRRHGQGTLTFPDGRKYVGEFKRSKIHGQGTLTLFDGDKYVGEFGNGNPRRGVLYNKNGNRIRDVQGTLTSSLVEQCYVVVKEGKKHGQGTFTSPNGNKYVGEYKDEKPNGKGTLTKLDGRKYVGEFKDGKYHGQGTMTYPDRSKYVGEWEDGKYHGQGKKTYYYGWMDGIIVREKYFEHKGEWKDGKYIHSKTN